MIKRKFSDKFSSQWIKVKFYKERPNLKEAKRLADVRFCQATKEAVMQPILLDRESISCPGARYVFGWEPDCKNGLLQSCYDKGQRQKNVLKSMLSQILYFKKPFNCIGLNTEGEPDLVMSYMPPGKIMDLIKIYHNYQGKNLDVSLCAMMSICGGVAVKAYLEGRMSLSFGCDDSRKFADMGRDNLAVGIPNRLFKAFVD